MRDIKFRAWSSELKMMSGSIGIGSTVARFEEGDKLVLCSAFEDFEIMQYSGFRSSCGEELYDGDVVYIGGYGNYEVEFPYFELFEAVMENDIGNLLGNIHQNPELLES